MERLRKFEGAVAIEYLVGRGCEVGESLRKTSNGSQGIRAMTSFIHNNFKFSLF
jgi:hypothetical protein